MFLLRVVTARLVIWPIVIAIFVGIAAFEVLPQVLLGLAAALISLIQWVTMTFAITGGICVITSNVFREIRKTRRETVQYQYVAKPVERPGISSGIIPEIPSDSHAYQISSGRGKTVNVGGSMVRLWKPRV